ncbi:hypothetical protein BDW22DRAFT_389626 [Trametopsis cervina]|nr:hypothetical protein BDW22DRAFT_389626 [Trametopsis cervina]
MWDGCVLSESRDGWRARLEETLERANWTPTTPRCAFLVNITLLHILKCIRTELRLVVVVGLNPYMMGVLYLLLLTLAVCIPLEIRLILCYSSSSIVPI